MGILLGKNFDGFPFSERICGSLAFYILNLPTRSNPLQCWRPAGEMGGPRSHTTVQATERSQGSQSFGNFYFSSESLSPLLNTKYYFTRQARLAMQISTRRLTLLVILQTPLSQRLVFHIKRLDISFITLGGEEIVE